MTYDLTNVHTALADQCEGQTNFNFFGFSLKCSQLTKYLYNFPRFKSIRELGSLAVPAQLRELVQHIMTYWSQGQGTTRPRFSSCGSHQIAPDYMAVNWLRAARESKRMYVAAAVSAHLSQQPVFVKREGSQLVARTGCSMIRLPQCTMAGWMDGCSF